MGYYQAAADQGSSNALYKVGELHLLGLGTPQNYQKAMDCFAATRDKNDSSLYGEGVLYCLGLIGETPDYTKASNCSQTLADKNVGTGWWKLGVMYLRGFGVTKNEDAAQKCFLKAFECGLQDEAKSIQEFQQSRLNTAVTHLELREYSAAFIYLLSLTQEGMKEAQDQLEQLCLDGHITDDNLSFVIRFFKEMHKRGEPNAAFKVGQLIMKLPLVSGFSFSSLSFSPRRSEENIKEALKWFQTAADEANGTDKGAAYHQMAMLLHEENTDLHQIPGYLEKAYLQDHPTAEDDILVLHRHYILKNDSEIANALMDVKDRIVEKQQKARLDSRMKWRLEGQESVKGSFDYATKQLEKYAKNSNDSLTEEYLFNTAQYFINCDRPDYALILLEPLAKKHHAKAQFLLGQMHMDGRGMSEINLDKAINYFKDAYNNGYDEAGFWLVDCYLKQASSHDHPNLILAKEIVKKMLSDQLAHCQPSEKDNVRVLFSSKPTICCNPKNWYEYRSYLKAALKMAKIHYLEKTSSREDLSALAQEIISTADKETRFELIEWYLTRASSKEDKKDAELWLQEINVTTVPTVYSETRVLIMKRLRGGV